MTEVCNTRPADRARAAWLDRMEAAHHNRGHVTVRGADIRYSIWDGPAGRPGILLVHGMHAHMRWWDPIAPYLADDSRVVTFDLSGMGDSAHREQYNSRLHAAEVIAVLKTAGVEGGIIIAHSYGATPAILACLDHPDLFSRMIILDSRISLPGMKPLTGSGQDVVWEKRLYASSMEALSRFRLTPPGPLADPEVLDHVARHSIRQTEGGWTWKFDSQLLRRIDLNMLVDPSRLTVPITYVCGENSTVSTPERMVLNRRYLPRAQFVTLPSAGHHLMIDQPLALVALLRGLLCPQ